MKVINLYGGPGAGKSTTAAGLFYQMKLKGARVELVTEFAKDLVYEGFERVLANQLAILGEQFHRMWRVRDQVDWVITDSPLLLSATYAREPFDQDWFYNTVLGAYNVFDNIDIIISRAKPYQAYGRTQTEDEARQIDGAIEELLTFFKRKPLGTVPGNEHAPIRIIQLLAPPPLLVNESKFHGAGISQS